jgi:MSHA biogenesis protein MshO
MSTDDIMSHSTSCASLAEPQRRHMPQRGKAARQAGFTLVEVVVVIVITAIVAGAVAVFIRLPVQGYVDSVARAELTDVGDLALRRMARDIRLALPNSIRVSSDGRYLELLLTKTGGRYLAEEDQQGGVFLKFENTAINCTATPADCQFEVVGDLPQGTQAIVPNSDWIVVYNLGADTAFSPANAYAGGNRALVTGVNNTTRVLTLQNNPFATQNPPMRSPSRRFQVVTTPVTYFCDGNSMGGADTLRRYWNYTIQQAQPTDSTAAPLSTTSSALLADGVVSCTFSYENLANVHSGLIGITLTLERPNSNSGKVVLFHQVHVDNTP